MNLFYKIDSEKELELIATLCEFMAEAIGGDPLTKKHNKSIARESFKAKSKTLKDLICFDINKYKNHVSKRLFNCCVSAFSGLKEILMAWIREDLLVIDDHTLSSDALRVTKEARIAEYKLSSYLDSLKSELGAVRRRYKRQHGGRDSEQEISSYSIRSSIMSKE